MRCRDRKRALTLVGKACHTIQDSFSAAHTVREPHNPELPWCIRKVKAYIERAPGFDTPDIEYHGAHPSDGIGHTTTEDSIYREGRDCHEPTTAADVERCLSDTAARTRIGTRDYLGLIRQLIALGPDDEERDTRVAAEIDRFAAQHLELCP